MLYNMTEYIAKPLGLSKAGSSGCGGSPEPLKRIRRDMFQRSNILYALRWNTGAGAPTRDTCIIDLTYDGYTMEDPHSSRPMIFLTDYAGKQSPYWLGMFQAPNGSYRYSAVGKHTVTIKVAPRVAPSPGTTSANETLPARDFSEAAGGITKTFEFEIYPTSDPLDPDPNMPQD
jgi:hypothetical protein